MSHNKRHSLEYSVNEEITAGKWCMFVSVKGTMAQEALEGTVLLKLISFQSYSHSGRFHKNLRFKSCS